MLCLKKRWFHGCPYAWGTVCHGLSGLPVKGPWLPSHTGRVPLLCPVHVALHWNISCTMVSLSLLRAEVYHHECCQPLCFQGWSCFRYVTVLKTVMDVLENTCFKAWLYFWGVLLIWNAETKSYELCNFIPIFMLLRRRVRVCYSSAMFGLFNFSLTQHGSAIKVCMCNNTLVQIWVLWMFYMLLSTSWLKISPKAREKCHK